MNLNTQHEKIECLHQIKNLVENTYCHAFSDNDKLLKTIKNRLKKETAILEAMYEKIYQ